MENYQPNSEPYSTADYELFHQFFELPASFIYEIEERADSSSLQFQRNNHCPPALATPKQLDGYFLDSKNQPIAFDVNGELTYCNDQLTDAYLVFKTVGNNKLTICREGHAFVAVVGDYKTKINLDILSKLMASLNQSYDDYIKTTTLTRVGLVDNIDCLADCYTLNSTIFADLSSNNPDSVPNIINSNEQSAEIITGSVSFIKNVSEMSITDKLVIAHHTQINTNDGPLNRVISGEFIKIYTDRNDDCRDLAGTVVYRPVGNYCLSYEVNGVKYPSSIEGHFEPINHYNGLLFNTMNRVFKSNEALHS